MNIDDQIKILEACKDGRDIIATNSSTERKISLNIIDGAAFNFQNYTYEIIPRELKHTWQPMDTIPIDEPVDLLCAGNAGRRVNVFHYNGLQNMSDYVAWMDAPLHPDWLDDE